MVMCAPVTTACELSCTVPLTEPVTSARAIPALKIIAAAKKKQRAKKQLHFRINPPRCGQSIALNSRRENPRFKIRDPNNAYRFLALRGGISPVEHNSHSAKTYSTQWNLSSPE